MNKKREKMETEIETIPPNAKDTKTEKPTNGENNRFRVVKVLINDCMVDGHLIREDGNRITVRCTDPTTERGQIVRTVFRKIFDRWQEECPE